MKEKCKKIFAKTAYLWEAIFSFVFAFCIYQFTTKKYYEGYFAYLYLVGIVIFGALTILTIIYNTKAGKGKLEKLFITYIIPVGISYMIFMLPTYAPDEIAHIWRAYGLSQGDIMVRQNEEGVAIGEEIPQILLDASHGNLNKYSKLNKILKQEIDYENIRDIVTPAQNYMFIFYVPSAIAFFIVRTLHISAIYGIYLGKIFNFIIFILGGYYTIKKIPFGKYIIFTCLFLPMVLQQAISISFDSLMNTTIFVYIAFTLSLVFREEKLNKKEKIVYFVLTALIALSKMTYLPIIGLGFILLFDKKMTKKEKIIMFGVGTLICCSLLVAHSMLTRNLEAEPSVYVVENHVDSKAQIEFILKNPISYVKMLIDTIKTNIEFYVNSCVGSPLGWLNIPISQIFIDMFLLLLTFSAFVEDNSVAFTSKQRIWNLCIVLATIILIITGLYIIWTGVGGNIALGVQGRYFIPVLPLLLLCFSMKHNYIKVPKVMYLWPIALTILNFFVVKQLFFFFII